MKLLSYLDGDVAMIGVVVDSFIAPVLPVDRFYTDLPATLELARQAVPAEAAPTLASVQPAPLVPAGAKIVCVGLNYLSHAQETGQELPPAPAIFARWSSTLNVDGGPIPVPPQVPGLDWEAELAVVIGTPPVTLGEAEMDRAVLGYTAFNDVTARTLQFASSQWTLGKNTPGSAPMGPLLVTADEIADPQDLHISTRVNGKLMQSARTSEMIFSIVDLLIYLQCAIDLQPGDVIATGTPAGIGYHRDPRILLAPGDEVVVELECIGTLRNSVVSGSYQRGSSGDAQQEKTVVSP